MYFRDGVRVLLIFEEAVIGNPNFGDVSSQCAVGRSDSLSKMHRSFFFPDEDLSGILLCWGMC